MQTEKRRVNKSSARKQRTIIDRIPPMTEVRKLAVRYPKLNIYTFFSEGKYYLHVGLGENLTAMGVDPNPRTAYKILLGELRQWKIGRKPIVL